MYEHLLVPVDGSELSHKAMEHAVGLAKMLGASITGFTVEPPLPVPHQPPGPCGCQWKQGAKCPLREWPR